MALRVLISVGNRPARLAVVELAALAEDRSLSGTAANAVVVIEKLVNLNLVVQNELIISSFSKSIGIYRLFKALRLDAHKASIDCLEVVLSAGKHSPSTAHRVFVAISVQ